jgi:hypothetical protein
MYNRKSISILPPNQLINYDDLVFTIFLQQKNTVYILDRWLQALVTQSNDQALCCKVKNKSCCNNHMNHSMDAQTTVITSGSERLQNSCGHMRSFLSDIVHPLQVFLPIMLKETTPAATVSVQSCSHYFMCLAI